MCSQGPAGEQGAWGHGERGQKRSERSSCWNGHGWRQFPWGPGGHLVLTLSSMVSGDQLSQFAQGREDSWNVGCSVLKAGNRPKEIRGDTGRPSAGACRGTPGRVMAAGLAGRHLHATAQRALSQTSLMGQLQSFPRIILILQDCHGDVSFNRCAECDSSNVPVLRERLQGSLLHLQPQAEEEGLNPDGVTP